MSANLVAFLAMALVWGLTWLPVKVGSAVVPPIFLAAMRFAVAGACYLAWSFAARLPLATDRPVRLVLSALLINTACYSFLFWGVAHAPTGLSAVVNLALMPVFTIAIGALAGEEAVTGRRIAAIAIGIGGLVLLFWARIAAGEMGGGAVLGLLSVIVATLAYAWGAIVSRPLVRTMPPVALATWQTILGGAGLFAASALVEPLGTVDPTALLRVPALPALAFLVIGGSLIGFTIYLKLLRDWGPFRAGLYSFVSPIIAVAVGVAFLGESFGPAEAVGGALMLAATALSLGPARPDRPVSAS